MASTYNDVASSVITDGTVGELTYFQAPLHKTIRLILVDICGILSIALNAMNLIVLKHTTCFGDATMKIIKVLAIVDLCTGVVVIALENAYLLTSIPDHWGGFCKTLFPMVIFFGVFSCVLLGLLSFDRYIAIRKPLRYPTLFTTIRLNVMIFACGLVAMCNAVLPSWRDAPLAGFVFNNETRFCRMMLDIDNTSSSLFLMIGNLTAPCAVIAITYINIHLVIIAWQNATKIRGTEAAVSQGRIGAMMTYATGPATSGTRMPTPTRRPSTKRQNKFRALRTILVMTLSFYIAWLPIFIGISMHVISRYDPPALYEFFMYYMPYSSSWVNPVIYLLMNRAYRKVAKRRILGYICVKYDAWKDSSKQTG